VKVNHVLATNVFMLQAEGHCSGIITECLDSVGERFVMCAHNVEFGRFCQGAIPIDSVNAV
jgi:hypothetical protein